MKNKFLSKSVPRGTRTIWRYLGALFILFTFAIGNVMAADVVHTYNFPSYSSTLIPTVSSANTKNNVTTGHSFTVSPAEDSKVSTTFYYGAGTTSTTVKKAEYNSSDGVKYSGCGYFVFVLSQSANVKITTKTISTTWGADAVSDGAYTWANYASVVSGTYATLNNNAETNLGTLAAGRYKFYYNTNSSWAVKKLVITYPDGGETPTCNSPEIAWATEPTDGVVGASDFVASVTTTPAEQAVTWTSSVPAAATVSNGTIHYVAPGFTKITAGFTYSGDDYCEEAVSVNKDIVVPISSDATGENDKYWYFTGSKPSSPSNGLTFSSNKEGAGMYGTKLNSDGYAWFVKPAVAGTLRVGAFKSDGTGSNYAVAVYACDDEGTKAGDALGTLTTPHAGGVSATMEIAAEVEGIYIQRSTSSEGVLYFVEFKAAPSCSAPTNAAISGETSYTEGEDIELTASADGATSATFTWYKGIDWATASAGSSIGSTATFTKNSCVEGDAGTYWCNISNGTGCEVQVSKAITVAPASCTDVAAPTDLAEDEEARTTEAITFTWTAADHASSYDVKLWDNAGCTGDPIASANVTTTSKEFTGLADETTYYCKVQSKGDGETYCTNGGTTVAVSGTTKALPSYSVTAATSTGDNTLGTVSAAASSIKAGATTTITAVPAAGYRVANWAVSGTGATISPSGASNSLTTTLTMGTADATVTVTFEAIPMYTVTLNPNKGTISDATGWTLNEGKYEKTVAEGIELALPAFTRTDYEFITWRAGAVDKTSPITVNAAIELKAIWGTEEEVTIYSWESPSGTAIEEGGTATHYNSDSPVDGNTRVNYKNTANSVDYYTISLNGKADYSTDHIRFALEENLKTGDEIKITGYYNKNSASTSAPLMKDGSGNTILEETTDWPNIYSGGSPEERTYIVPEGINSNALKLTRNDQHTGTVGFITKLVITRTEVVEELDPAEKPTITTQPGGGTYEWNQDPTMSVTASVTDGGTLSYQWYEKGETDTKVGSNSASYAPTVSGTYYVIVTNTKTGYAKTTTKSNEVLVTINPRPSYKVSYYDGEVKLGEETVYEGESPINAGNFDDLPMATFQGWFNNADLAQEHAVATIGEEVITKATSYYSKWNKTFAQDVDLVQLVLDNAEEDAYKTFDYAEFLSGKGYLLTEGTGNENALDKSNAFDTGLKLKKSTDNKLQFNVEADKIVKLTVGKINGMSIAINGASATAIPGGTDATHLGVSYYYSANPQAVTIAETSANYNMLRAIAFLDPMTVTYDATTNGGSCATDEAIFTGTALTLPEAEKEGSRFDGWFTTANDETETGTLVGLGGASYTPAASITLYARFTATTSLATLTDIKVNGTTITGFAADKYEYTIEFPYKTAVVPTIAYTRGYEGDGESAGEAVTMNPNPITSVTGDVTLHVVSEDGTVEQDYVLHFTEAPKDMLCLVWADVDGDNKLTYNATKSKYYAAADVTLANSNVKGKDGSAPSGKKFQSNGYLKIALNEGTFNEGDIVALDVTYGTANVMHVFKAQTALEADVIGTASGNTDAGLNKVAITEDAATLWLVRGGDYDSWNPHVDYVAVYRAYPNPLVGSMAINSIDVTVNNAASTKTITGVMPSGTNFASLSISNIAYLSNNPSETDGVLSGSWNDLTSQYEGTFTVTDKDFDVTVYTVTLTEDVAVESVSVSGETTVAAKSQITLTATVLPADVANKVVTWSSSDETKATVDANGVVTGKAAGSVTITATSVADGTKKGTLDITVTKFVGTEYAYWFASTTDATTNDITNDNGTIFENAPTDGSSLSASLTMDVNEVETTYSVTRRSGDSDFGTFHVPADYTANLHMLVIGSGSPRTLTLKETSTNTEYSSAPATFGDAAAHIVFANIPSGNYTFDKHSQSIRVALMVAELNSYPLTSVALEEGFNLRLEQSRTPVFTITPAKAAVASQEWSEVSRTGASDATLNTSTGEITAGTEEGTLTVMVTLTDAFGNEVESGNCVVKIVNIIDQKDVTGSMTWNWTGAGTANVTIDNEEALVLGNYINGDQWAYIKGTKNDYAYNTNNSGCYQGYGTLSFKTTVPGLVTITARRISNNADLKIGEDAVLSLESSNKTSKAYFVPAGEVNIIADATKGMRILKIEFDANITADKAEGSHFGGYTRPVTIDRMGTVCVDHNVPAGCIVGAEVYKLLYWKYGTSWENCQMVDFEQVEEMNAGEPYMIIPTESTFALFYGKTTVDEPKHMPNGFIGTFDAIAAAPDNVLVGKYGIINNTIQKLGTNCNSPANRAYIDLSQTPSKEEYEASVNQSSAPVKKRISLSHKAEQVTTSLDAINVESEQIQKVLIDGQMYVVRGGHVYDATGKLVK